VIPIVLCVIGVFFHHNIPIISGKMIIIAKYTNTNTNSYLTISTTNTTYNSSIIWISVVV